MDITVIGQGFIGIPYAAGLASLGHNVVGYDLNAERINQLSEGICPIHEKGLPELLKKAKANLFFTSDPTTALLGAEAVLCCVGTPTKPNGDSDTEAVMAAADTCIDVWKSTANRKRLFVIKSTVPVGTNTKAQKKFDEAGIAVHVVSNPEFIAEGRAVEDFFEPDRIVIGARNPEAFAFVHDLYQPLFKHADDICYHIDVIPMSPESAELVKLAANGFLATKISFANEMARLCDSVPNADVVDVLQAVGSDNRIGPWGLKPGVGYGGYCFPKDSKALYVAASRLGITIETLGGAITTNRRHMGYLAEKVLATLPRDGDVKIGVLGLTFKAFTDDCRESAAIEIIKMLLRREKTRVVAYDPQGMSNAMKLVEGSTNFSTVAKPEVVFEAAHAVLVLTEWPEFKGLFVPSNTIQMASPYVFDFRNLVPEAAELRNVIYYGVGREMAKSER